MNFRDSRVNFSSSLLDLKYVWPLLAQVNKAFSVYLQRLVAREPVVITHVSKSARCLRFRIRACCDFSPRLVE